MCWLVVTDPASTSQRVPSNEDSTIFRHNEESKAKFYGNGNDPASVDDIIYSFNAHNIELLPFIVDQLGGIGHFGHRFLYGSQSIQPCPHPLPTGNPNHFTPSPMPPTNTTLGLASCCSRPLPHTAADFLDH
jgi:hypothetical protein